MKKINIALASLALLGGFAACSDELDVENPNTQTTADFGDDESELDEAVIACYNRIRLEGTFARVGYTMDAVRGDEVWNASQVWYLPYDELNAGPSDEIGNQWIWRDCYHVVNRTNFVLQQVEKVSLSDDSYKQIKGQALFLRALAYYTLTTYQQNVPLIVDYSAYSDIQTMYMGNSSQDEVFDQIDKDLAEAMTILPSRDEGGEWAQGRATCGSAAGYLARSYMFRHKYAEAYEVLKDIIAGKYGSYKLMSDYGDNFREGTAYENNAESLFEVQFMDYGTGGVDQEWTPVNISSEATQGHAVEANYGPTDMGSWSDLAVSPWLYNLFKAEKCTDGTLDPRLYWTINSYEPEYDTYTGVKTAAYPNGDPRCNIIYQQDMRAVAITKTYGDEDKSDLVECNWHAISNNQGGISIAKFTNSRNNIYSVIDAGLYCGVNLRLMRYSDVLLRAAECENELNGPTQTAIDYINQVRSRVGLANLQKSDFPTADALFEQIANVERPKEFGCENGRGIDLIRWGFFYDAERLAQISDHSAYNLVNRPSRSSYEAGTAEYASFPEDLKAYYDKLGAEATTSNCSKYSYSTYQNGHEYFPIATSTLDANPKLVGNSANNNYNNGVDFRAKYSIHPVYDLSK